MANLGETAKDFADELVKIGYALGELAEKLKPDSMPCDKTRIEFVEISGTEIQKIMNALRCAGPACTALSKFVIPVAKRRKVLTNDRRNLFLGRPLLMTSDN